MSACEEGAEAIRLLGPVAKHLARNAATADPEESQALLEAILAAKADLETARDYMRRYANPEWREFLDAHPELAPSPLDLSDDSILAALTRALEEWNAYADAQGFARRAYAFSGCVARVLAGVTVLGDGPLELRPSPGDAIRVGRRLGELAKQGRVVQVSTYQTTKRWAPRCDSVTPSVTP